jgi:predicted oxidoreductase
MPEVDMASGLGFVSGSSLLWFFQQTPLTAWPEPDNYVLRYVGLRRSAIAWPCGWQEFGLSGSEQNPDITINSRKAILRERLLARGLRSGRGVQIARRGSRRILGVGGIGS